MVWSHKWEGVGAGPDVMGDPGGPDPRLPTIGVDWLFKPALAN